MTEQSDYFGCLGQSFRNCLGFFKTREANTDKSFDSGNVFLPINGEQTINTNYSMKQTRSETCPNCCALGRKSMDREYPYRQVTVLKQPEANLQNTNTNNKTVNTVHSTSGKTNDEKEIQKILAITNPDKLVTNSPYLKNNKEEVFCKTNALEINDNLSSEPVISNNCAKNRESKITSSDNNSVIKNNELNSNKNNAHLISTKSDMVSNEMFRTDNNNKKDDHSQTQNNLLCDAEEVGVNDILNKNHDSKYFKGDLNTDLNIQNSKVKSNIQAEPVLNEAIMKKNVSEEINCNGNLNGVIVHDTKYFRNLTESETRKLNNLCERWQNTIQENVPEEIQNEIRSVIGQTNLVISERFSQFLSLVDRAEGISTKTNQENLKPITNSDLQGFWDMIYFQVEDVVHKFQRLSSAKENNWVFEKRESEPVKKSRPPQKRRPANSKAKTTKPLSESEKARKEAARKRILEARKAMALRKKEVQSSNGQSDSVIIM